MSEIEEKKLEEEENDREDSEDDEEEENDEEIESSDKDVKEAKESKPSKVQKETKESKPSSTKKVVVVKKGDSSGSKGKKFESTGSSKLKKGQTSKEQNVNAIQFAIIGVLLVFTIIIFVGMGMGRKGQSNPSQEAQMESPAVALESLKRIPEIDSLVLSRFGGGEYYFYAKVDRVEESEKRIHLRYLDGDEEWKRLSDLRSDSLREGQRVEVRTEGGRSWVPAQIIIRDNDQFTVRLDTNRENQRVNAAAIRVREAI